MDNILIAGCGYIGEALGEQLAQQGHRVWGMTRQARPLAHGLTNIVADLSEPESLHNLPTSLDYIFFTAAAPQYSDEAYQAVYVQGLRHLLSHLKKQKVAVRRIIFTSSTAVYAQTGGEWVDETSETKPSHFSGKRMLKAEELLTKSPFDTAIARFGGIYGPGRTRLLNEVIAGKARLTEVDVFTNRIHQADCVQCLLHLMHTPGENQIYNGVDMLPSTYNDIVTWLSEQLHSPTPEVGHRLSQRMRANKRCNSQKLRDTGFEFAYPTFKEGFMSVLDDTVFDEAVA